jgi:hypothetical protein
MRTIQLMTPTYGRSASSALHATVEILILEVVEMLEAHRAAWDALSTMDDNEVYHLLSQGARARHQLLYGRLSYEEACVPRPSSLDAPAGLSVGSRDIEDN